jgi:hypothetical protein
VPDTIRPEEAVTVPLAVLTAVLALFSEDSLAIDEGTEVRESVLIWGGSCAFPALSSFSESPALTLFSERRPVRYPDRSNARP